MQLHRVRELLVTSSYLLLVVRPGSPSSVLAPSSDAESLVANSVTSSNTWASSQNKNICDLASSTDL